MAVIESAQAQAATESAARLERLAAAREEQGRADRAAVLRERSAAASRRAATESAVVNRNVPTPSGPVEYVRNSRGGRRETATYEPVSVRKVGDQVIVERRDLLRDPYASGGVKREPYVKERVILNASGEVVSREVYDTYTAKSGRQLSYLSSKETPEEVRETRRNDAGEKLRETVTDKASGQTQKKSYDPGAKAAQESELAARGLSREEIANLSPGQRRAILDPSRASTYTGTRVPGGIAAKAAAGSVREVSDGKRSYLGSVKDGVFLGVRPVSESERAEADKAARMLRMRATPGVSVTQGGQFGRGRSVYASDVGGSVPSGRELFESMDPPKRVLLGDITFGRERRLLLKREGLAPEFSFPLEGEEAARRTKVYAAEYAVPNAETARFAGFPTVDDSGAAVAFPATYRGLEEDRQEFGRVGAFDKPAAYVGGKLERLDAAAVRLAAEPPSIVTVRGNVGMLVRGVQAAGKGLERAGDVFVAKSESGRIGPGGLIVGEFFQERGVAIQERPVTAGAGEAVLLGAGFGAVARGAQAVRAAGYAVRGEKVVKRAGGVARAARIIGGIAVTTERAAGLGLGAGFAYDVGTDLRAAQDGREQGAILGKASGDLIGFGLGARAGVRGADAGIAEARLIASTNLGRRGAVGGRSARERSGRISKAELRNRKQARALAPKYEVSQDQWGIAVELRGRARKLTREERILRQEFDLASRRSEVVRDEGSPNGLRTDEILTYVARQGGKQTPEFYNREAFTVKEIQTGPTGRRISGTFRGITVTPGKGLVSDGASIRAPAGVKAPKIVPSGGDRFAVELRESIGERLGRGVRARKGAEGARERAPPVLLAEKRTVKDRPGGQGDAVVSRAELDRSGRRFGKIGNLKDTLRFSVDKGTGRVMIVRGMEQGRGPGVELELSAPPTSKNRPRFVIPETEAPYRSRDKSPSSPYVQRVPVVTVAPEFGAPDLRGAPAFLRERAREFSRGSPEDRRLRAVARLRELAAERARELERASVRELPKPAEVRVERAKPKARPRILERSRPLAAVKLGAGARLRAVPAVSAGLGSRSLSRTVSISSSKSIQRQELKESQDLAGAFGGGGSSKLSRREVTPREPVRPPREPPGRLIRNRPTPEPLEPVKPGLLDVPDLSREKRGEPGYTVLVKSRGQFRSLTNVPLTRKEALIAGSRAVDVGASQTFKIVRARESARPGKVAGAGSIKKFKDTGGDVFRERRGRALIDTAGELSEITFKGLRSRKARV